ncbi:MAG: ammonia channel protein, partial [Rhizobiaceae bacterium]|nr:ammonia channel protein [Rhizobiaceae bacterium]
MTIRSTIAPLSRAALLGTLVLGAFGTTAAFAQETATTMDKGDTAFMMIATVLVLFMTMPGLALFYGGLVRAKNMLSVLMQCTMIAAVVMVVWVLWGY